MERKISDYLKKEKSMVAALNRACAELCDGDTIFLGGNRIDVDTEEAFTKYYYISNNEKGNKKIAFPIIGKKNITIDGEGAELVFHGDILPFVVDDSCNITIKNLSIDYAVPMFAQANIIESQKDRIALAFDGEDFCCKVRDNQLVFFSSEDEAETQKECALCLEFESDSKAPSAYSRNYFYYSGAQKDHGFLSHMYKDVTFTELRDNVIEMRGDFESVHTAGNMWVCTYAGRKYPGILINEAKDVCVQNVALYQTQGMGIIVQLSENIILDQVRAELKKDSKRLLTTGADATHFVNCRGNILIKDCKFINMMDDACNIHGIYLKDPKKESEYSFIATYGHEQQVGMNIFKTGDTVSIIHTENLEEVVKAQVAESYLLDEKTLRVVTQTPLPLIPKDCVAENLSTAPEVHILRTESGNNRPRGFLLSSAGKMLVEECKFYNMFSAISVGGEMLDWYESGAVSDITIRNNEFCNSAYAGGVAIYIYPLIKHRETAGSFHGNVTIEDNHFTMHEKRLLVASNVRELQFLGNTFTYDETLPTHPADNEHGIIVEYCENMAIGEL